MPGVWDVMTDQEAVEMVLEHCRREKASSSSCGEGDEGDDEDKGAVTPSHSAAELLVSGSVIILRCA
jgi:hypothetical protein